MNLNHPLLKIRRAIFPALLAILLVIWTAPCARAQSLTGWNLTFDDEFSGTNLDTNMWNTSYPWDAAAQRTLVHPNGDELEVYWDNQYEESNGILRLRADKVDSQWYGKTYNYSSGMISSYSHFAQQYGYFEMRGKMPHGNGLWPAFWMGLNRKYWPPEVDILEILDSYEDQPHHGGIENPSGAYWSEFYPSFNSTTGYHVYALEWDTNHLSFYLDGMLAGQTRVGTNMTEPMQVIANLAVGGVGTIPPDATTVFPAYMDIDYIRIWSRTNAAAAIPNTVGYDIGNVGLTGSTAVWTNGTGTVAGAGLGYAAGTNSDSFQYAAEPVPGELDYDYLIEISSTSVTNGQAGVMIRENTDANSPYTALFISGGNCVLQSRAATGAAAVQNAEALAVASPTWLRLVRRGNAFSGYQSADGISWTFVGAVTNDLSTGITGNSIFVGTAVSSGSTSTLNNVNLASVNQPAIEVIKDNADATGVTITGSWTVTNSIAGFYGSNYMATGSSGASVKFVPNLPYTATYDVYLRWAAFEGRSTQAPVIINYAGGTTNLTVNEEHEGGQWIWLGAFPFNSGSGASVLLTNAASGSICADAVRFVPGVAAAPSAPTVPDAPANLVSLASPDRGQVTLAWDPADGAVTYNVKRGTTSGGPYTNIATGVLPSYSEFTDSNAVAGATNYYVVTAVNNANPGNPGGQESAASNEAETLPSIVVDNTNAVPAGTWNTSTSAPGFYGTNYLNDGDAGTNKSMTYTPAVPVAGNYDVYLRWTTGTNRASNVPVDIIYDGGAATNPPIYINQQLSYGVWWVYLGTWYFTAGSGNSLRIRDDGANGYVIADAAEFVAVPQPPVPTGLTATGGNGQVSLAWNASVGATSYPIIRALSSGGPYTNIATASATNYTDTGLTDGTTYFYSVAAANASQTSGYCPYVGVTTLATTPAGLTATDGDARVILNWNAATGATGYNVKRATTSGGPYTTIATGVSMTSYTNSGLADGTTYYYVVSATDAGGESADSAETAGTPQSLTLIKDNADSSGIAISGTWTASTNVAGYYGANYLYDGDPIGGGNKIVMFTPTITTAGYYNVYARWTANPNRASNARVDVVSTAGTNTFYVDQRSNNGTWVLLGTFQFNAGTGGNVSVHNAGANGYVVADAVEFVLY